MQIPRIIFRALFGIALAAVLSSCGSRAGSLSALPSTFSSQYSLAPGDQVRVYVYGLDAYNNVTFTVGDDGTLSLPMIDKVPARGKTFPQLEAGIRQALLDHQILKTPIVNVQPTSLRPFYILGEVNKPGEYTYRPGMTVLAAVSMAGGFTFRAKEGEVSITRVGNGRPQVGRARPSDPIMPGDQIQVYERWF